MPRPAFAILGLYRLVRPRRFAKGCSIALAVLLPLVLAFSIYWPSGRASPLSMLPGLIEASTSGHRFDITQWELAALADGLLGRLTDSVLLRGVDDSQQRKLVEDYFAAIALSATLRSRMNAAAIGPSTREGPDGNDVEQRLAESLHDRDRVSRVAGNVVARQIDDYLATTGVGGGALKAHWRLGFPPLTFEVVPPVFFRFTELPLLLVVAPRDRIQVIESSFLDPALSNTQMDQIESQIDTAGVSSLVLPIGGFAAYPSMVTGNASLLFTLQAIAHEWTHHYLTLRPLGQHYLVDYKLRTINETVADLVGKEIGKAVYDEYYAPYSKDSASPANRPTPAIASFDFGSAMAEIRQTVEAMLARDDVGGAEQYMSERRQWLQTKGYYLRKLNTAYLTFYGAYAGSGNSYEPRLQSLLQQCGSLDRFLRTVATITSESDLQEMTCDLRP